MSYRGAISNALLLHVQFKVWRSNPPGENFFFFVPGRFVLFCFFFLTYIHFLTDVRWPEPIYMRVGYVFESRFSAGKI